MLAAALAAAFPMHTQDSSAGAPATSEQKMQNVEVRGTADSSLSNLLGQDFVNRGSFLEEGRGLVLREARIEGGASVRATLEVTF